MGGSKVSRRVSEFVGVALFAAALIWIIALASYEPSDPAWFFSTGAHADAGQLRGARRRVPRRAVVPAVRLRGLPRSGGAGDRRLELFLVPIARRGGHQADRRRPAVRLPQRVPRPGLRHARGLGQVVPRRRLRRRVPRAPDVRVPEPDRLGDRRADADRAGDHHLDPVLLRPLLRGRDRGCARRRDPRRRGLPRLARGAAARAAAPRGDRQAHQERRPRSPRSRRRRPPRRRRAKIAPIPPVAAAETASARAKHALARAFGRSKDKDQDQQDAAPTAIAAPAAVQRTEIVRAAEAAEGRRAVAAAARSGADVEGAGRAPQGRVRAAAGVAARQREDRAQDRRARADGERAAARGEVPRVLGRRQRRPDSPGPGRHDLRVQAGRRREIREDHRPRRRSLPRDEGRLGADRSHCRQVDRRHPDPEPHPRADLAARAARIRGLPASPPRS